MLQQTQVCRVVGKYEEFIRRFPSFSTLASASLRDVLQAWQGLGYNRRGKWVHDGARIIVNDFANTIPTDVSLVDSLPGVGLATAASIVCFTHNLPVVCIETNIRRVYLFHFFSNEHDVTDGRVMQKIEETIDRENPREWYWALMDYGAYLATVVENPNRRSRHYVKQKKFEGSRRQVRGRILREYLKHGWYDVRTDQEKLVWETLKQEGFICHPQDDVKDPIAVNL
jgi:A/G-specific adenine glycosylase